MVTLALSELNQLLLDLLKPHKFRDYCPNGLQVEGSPHVQTLVTGVTASQALIEAAITKKAQAILVHHGYFWKGEAEAIVGIKKRRIQALLDHNISLFAYHLPLDAHLELGNNVQLARQLGWTPVAVEKNYPLPMIRTAEFYAAVNAAEIFAQLESRLARVPMHIDTGRPIKRIGWCTGAAQSYFQEAIDMGVDAFVSGEISEQTVHLARESGVHYFAAGHHATERYGVKALGEHLAETCQLDVHFIDCDNPV